MGVDTKTHHSRKILSIPFILHSSNDPRAVVYLKGTETRHSSPCNTYIAWHFPPISSTHCQSTPLFSLRPPRIDVTAQLTYIEQTRQLIELRKHESQEEIIFHNDSWTKGLSCECKGRSSRFS